MSTKSRKNMDKLIFFTKDRFFSKDWSQLLKKIDNQLSYGKRPLIIFTPNLEQLVQTTENHQFAANLAAADIQLPDGMGLVWAQNWWSRIKQDQPPIKSRITGREVAAELLTMASQRQLPLVVIGGRNYRQAANQAGVDWLPAYDDAAHPQPAEEKKLTKALQKLAPEIVLVGFGAPVQEQWVIDHRQLLTTIGVKVVLVVGGALDVIWGQLAAAPAWMQQWGLEWLFRLVQQPWRWRRQLRLVKFWWRWGRQLIDT